MAAILKDRLETVLYNLLEAIRASSIWLSPFLPEASEKINNQLQVTNYLKQYVDNNEYQLNEPTPLFMRIDNK